MALVFRRDKTDRVTHRMGATCSANPVDVILRVHRKVVVHHVRDAIDINAARSDIGGHEHTDRSRFKILKCAEPLILRTVRMNRAGPDPSGFEFAGDAIGSALRPCEHEHGVELRIGQQMEKES
jgi:hypothetical protein